MDISTMRSYVRSVVDIDTSDISDDVMNRFLGEAYDVILQRLVLDQATQRNLLICQHRFTWCWQLTG